MSTIITQPAREAHPDQHPDAAARRRRDRLARATAGDMEAALAFLSMIDPEAFEIALTAATPPADQIPEDTVNPDDTDGSVYPVEVRGRPVGDGERGDYRSGLSPGAGRGRRTRSGRVRQARRPHSVPPESRRRTGGRASGP
jgi:hypothetical protein